VLGLGARRAMARGGGERRGGRQGNGRRADSRQEAIQHSYSDTRMPPWLLGPGGPDPRATTNQRKHA